MDRRAAGVATPRRSIGGVFGRPSTGDGTGRRYSSYVLDSHSTMSATRSPASPMEFSPHRSRQMSIGAMGATPSSSGDPTKRRLHTTQDRQFEAEQNRQQCSVERRRSASEARVQSLQSRREQGSLHSPTHKQALQ